MLVWLLIFCSIVVTFGQQCTLHCDTCFNGLRYYAVKDTINGSICERNERASDFFLLGRIFCDIGGEEIREETTCDRVIRDSAGFRDWRIEFTQLAEVDTEWDNSSGCNAIAQPLSWLGAEPFKQRLCLETNRNAWGTVIAVTAGLVAGITWAFVSNGCRIECCEDSGTKDTQRFKPGAKYVAAQTILTDYQTDRSLLLAKVYRLCQVSANACLPAVLPIFFHPCIVVVFYILLYVLPAATFAPIFLRSIYLVATPDISLLGIDDVQPETLGPWDRKTLFLYSAIRPYIMVLLTSCAAAIASSVTGNGGIALNPTGFFRTSLQFGWGPTVLISAILISVFGTIMYSILAFILVFQKKGREIIPISLEAHDKLRQQVNNLTDDITNSILNIESKFPQVERRPAIDAFFVEHEENIERFRFTKGEYFFELFDGCLNLASICYKVFLFRRSGQYHLVFVLVCLLTQSIALSALQGTLYRGRSAVPRSLYLSVRTVGFYNLVRWHEQGVSVYALMVAIYGLPLASSTTWWSCCLAIAMLAKGIYNLAITLGKAIDLDMFDGYTKSGTYIGLGRGEELSRISTTSMSSESGSE